MTKEGIFVLLILVAVLMGICVLSFNKHYRLTYILETNSKYYPAVNEEFFKDLKEGKEPLVHSEFQAEKGVVVR